MATIKKMITFTPQGWEALKKFQEEKHLLSEAEAVRMCISIATDKPVYAKIEDRRKKEKDLTPEERVKAKEEEKLAKEKVEQENQLNFCRALQGTIDERNGHKYCQFPIFTLVDYPEPKGTIIEKYITERPLDFIGTGTLEEQYRNGSKDQIDAFIETKGVVNVD